jgi:hypothetical protein
VSIMVAEWVTDLITFAVSCVVLFLAYRIILVVLKRIDERKPGTTSSIKMIRLLLRFILIFTIIILIFSIFNISSPLLLSLSSISGIIIGFASTEIVTQIIAGIYLIVSRPFTVNDLVRIQNIEGLVIEISLNHTVIKQFDNTLMLIPNKILLEAQILNFTMDIKNELKINKQADPNSEANSKAKGKKGKFQVQNLTKLIGDLAEFVHEDEITQYVFDIDIDFDKDPTWVMEQLDAVCEMYKKVYYRKPRFKVVGFGYRAKVRFWVHALSPQVIMDNQNSLIRDIAIKIHAEAQS